MKLSDIIVIMYSKGQLSEGKAASLIGVDRLTLRTMRDALITPSDDKSEKIYSTRGLIEHLENALDNGYDQLGATDIGDLLLMCETGTLLNPNHEGGRTLLAADGGEGSPDSQDFKEEDDRPLCTTCGENPAYANETCVDCIEKGALA